MDETIMYEGRQVVVSAEVAAFLSSDDRRLHAGARSDRRHLSRENFETVPKADLWVRRFELENKVQRTLRMESLCTALAALSATERELIHLYYFEERTMAEIGSIFGISKMAVSKRHAKLLDMLRGLIW